MNVLNDDFKIVTFELSNKRKCIHNIRSNNLSCDESINFYAVPVYLARWGTFQIRNTCLRHAQSYYINYIKKEFDIRLNGCSEVGKKLEWAWKRHKSTKRYNHETTR